MKKYLRKNNIEVQRKTLNCIRQMRMSIDNLTNKNSSFIFATEQIRHNKTISCKPSQRKQFHRLIIYQIPTQNRVLQKYVLKKTDHSRESSIISSDLNSKNMLRIPKTNPLSRERMNRRLKIVKDSLCMIQNHALIKTITKELKSTPTNESRIKILTPTVIQIYGKSQAELYKQKTRYNMINNSTN